MVEPADLIAAGAEPVGVLTEPGPPWPPLCSHSLRGMRRSASRYHHSANAFVITFQSLRPWTTNTLERTPLIRLR